MHVWWKMVGIDLLKLDLFKNQERKFDELKSFKNKIFFFWKLVSWKHAWRYRGETRGL